jgi:hypothetical protein
MICHLRFAPAWQQPHGNYFNGIRRINHESEHHLSSDLPVSPVFWTIALRWIGQCEGVEVDYHRD